MKHVLRSILEDNDEPIFYHSYAKYYSSFYDDEYNEFLETSLNTINDPLKDIIYLCESLTPKERKIALESDYTDIKVPAAAGDKFHVGYLMDNLKKMVSNQMELNSKTIMNHEWKLVLDLPPSHELRFAKFMNCCGKLKSLRPVPKEVFTILKIIYQHKKEPVLYKAYAAACLCMLDKDNSMDPEAKVECMKETIRLCDSAKTSERSGRVCLGIDENGNKKVVQVETLLNNLKKDAKKLLNITLQGIPDNQHLIQYCERMVSFVDKNQNRDSRSNACDVEKIRLALERGGSSISDTFPRSPEITSAVIDKIKALPEKDIAVYLFRENYIF